MTDDKLAELRLPFPEGTVGLLPKPLKKDSQRGKCPECGGYHGLPAMHLDYVGHAAVTDRLLSVDPRWTWEPLAVDERGLPALDRDGNLWIRLTVCGVTRLGVGDGPSMKERIGDALRNAAMRFGVALSLWTKDELGSGMTEDKATAKAAIPPSAAGNLQEMTDPAQATRRRPPPQVQPSEVTEISPKRRLLQACGGDVKMAERLWEEAFGVLGTESPERGLTQMELEILLSRAQAELNAGDGAPL